MNEQHDLIEAWKGQVGQMRRDAEAIGAREFRSARRASEALHACYDSDQREAQAQETCRSLRGALDSARARLDRMHVAGCLQTGWDCPACEAIEELDSY